MLYCEYICSTPTLSCKFFKHLIVDSSASCDLAEDRTDTIVFFFLKVRGPNLVIRNRWAITALDSTIVPIKFAASWKTNRRWTTSFASRSLCVWRHLAALVNQTPCIIQVVFLCLKCMQLSHRTVMSLRLRPHLHQVHSVHSNRAIELLHQLQATLEWKHLVNNKVQHTWRGPAWTPQNPLSLKSVRMHFGGPGCQAQQRMGKFNRNCSCSFTMEQYCI